MRWRSPPAALAAGVALVALFAIATAVQIRAVVLDEAVYKLAASLYADAPSTLPTEETSRGLARVYSLLVFPLVAVFDGDVAVRLARVLNCLLFASAAVPLYLVACRVVTSRWLAAGAAVLAVAVPWLTLGTIMFSEALAYAGFATALWAMTRALRTPSWRADLLVLVLLVVLVGVRVQFLALLPAWLVVVAVNERPWGGPRAAARRFPVLAGAAAVAVVVLLGVLLTGELRGLLDRFGGPYAWLQDRGAYTGDFGTALLWEVGMLSLGVGVVPAILAAYWFAAALRRSAGEPSRELALIAAVALGALFASTLWAQGGWLDLQSEERYFIYAVPLLWIGAAAALDRRALVGPGQLLLGGVVLFILYANLPNPVSLRGEQLFLGPVSEVVRWSVPRLQTHVDDLLGVQGIASAKDVVAVAALAVAALSAWLWRRPSRRVLALAPAVLLQLMFVAYAFAGVNGKLDGIGGATGGASFAELGWVDRASGGEKVVFADNGAERRDALLRDTTFWNDDVQELLSIPSLRQPPAPYPVDTMALRGAEVLSDLRVSVDPSRPLVLQAPESPLWQLEGRVRATSYDGRLTLLAPVRPARSRWFTEGLDPDGNVPMRGAALTTRAGRVVEVDVAVPAAGAAVALRIELGGARAGFDSANGARQTLRLDACEGRGPLRGAIRAERGHRLGDGRTSAGRLLAVRFARCPGR